MGSDHRGSVSPVSGCRLYTKTIRRGNILTLPPGDHPFSDPPSCLQPLWGHPFPAVVQDRKVSSPLSPLFLFPPEPYPAGPADLLRDDGIGPCYRPAPDLGPRLHSGPLFHRHPFHPPPPGSSHKEVQDGTRDTVAMPPCPLYRPVYCESPTGAFYSGQMGGRKGLPSLFCGCASTAIFPL